MYILQTGITPAKNTG